jgi:hypothetical protein
VEFKYFYRYVLDRKVHIIPWESIISICGLYYSNHDVGLSVEYDSLCDTCIAYMQLQRLNTKYLLEPSPIPPVLLIRVPDYD